MTTLLIANTDARPGTAITAFGGLPLIPRGTAFEWPVCRTCKGNMLFLGQLLVENHAATESRLILLFHCENDPGMCDEWDANLGGSKAVFVKSKDWVLAEAPTSGVTRRNTWYGTTAIEVPEAAYDAARENWIKSSGKPGRAVLGQIYGTPTWIQQDETPECDYCQKPMSFIAQLEQGPDHKTEMNFGGGCAYVFKCECGIGSAKLLSQC